MIFLYMALNTSDSSREGWELEKMFPFHQFLQQVIANAFGFTSLLVVDNDGYMSDSCLNLTLSLLNEHPDLTVKSTAKAAQPADSIFPASRSLNDCEAYSMHSEQTCHCSMANLFQ